MYIYINIMTCKNVYIYKNKHNISYTYIYTFFEAVHLPETSLVSYQHNLFLDTGI